MSESNLPLPNPFPSPSNPAAAGPAYYGPPPPRPFGQVLDRIFQLMRSRFRLFLSIAAVPALAWFALYALMGAVIFLFIGFPHPAQPPRPEVILRAFLPVALIVAVPLMAVFALFFAAAIHAATQAGFGVRVTFREAYAVAWRRAGRHILLLVWIYLRAFLPALVIVFSIFAGMSFLIPSPNTNPNPALFLLFPLGMLLYFAAYVYGIIVALRLSLAFPACIVEGLSARDAINRSSHLTQGAKGRIFLVLLVVYAIAYALLLVLYAVAAVLAIVALFGATALHVHLVPPWSYIGLGLLAICGLCFLSLSIALMWAAFTTSLAVLYHDQRLRKDILVPAPPLE